MIDDLPSSPVLPCATPASLWLSSSRRPQRLGGGTVLLASSQSHHHPRNFPNRLRMRQRPSRRRHALQPPRIADQSRNRLDQISRAQITFFDHHCRTHSFQRPRIHILMIIGCGRKRHENGRLRRRWNIANRAGTRTADQQISAPERPRHIVNKLVDLARNSRPLISGEHVVIVALPRLMNDVNPRNLIAQPSQRFHHRLIDSPCPLTPPKDQQSRHTAGLGRNRKERRAHRNSRHPAVRKILTSFFKVHRRRGNPASDHSVSKPRYDVRLKSQRRKPPPNRRDHSRSRGVSPYPNHNFRIEFRKHPRRSRNRARQIKHRLRPRHQADILQRADLNQLQTKPRLRHQSRLHAASRPDKKTLGAKLRRKLLSDGQRRNNVPASSSARNDDAHEFLSLLVVATNEGQTSTLPTSLLFLRSFGSVRFGGLSTPPGCIRCQRRKEP